MTGGYWSTYWYNGAIYASEIARGVDVFRLKASEFLSQAEIDAAALIRVDELNTQEQTRVVWPASSVVARAYIDQLTRTKGIQPDRARAVRTALERADQARSSQDKGAAPIVDQLETLAKQVEGDAASAAGRDAARLKSLAATIKERAARMRG